VLCKAANQLDKSVCPAPPAVVARVLQYAGHWQATAT
jgi:hypothetical protein